MEATTAKVTLVRYTERPEQTIAAAARLCYAAETDALFEGDVGQARKLIRRLRAMGHLSPFEHASFTFYVEGVSRTLTHQLVRHRIASYSQRSQRYVRHDGFDYVIPPQLEGKKVHADGEEVDAVAFYRETMALLAERYCLLNEALGDVGEVSNEDARYVLPNACETKIVVTMNARQFLYFFEERLCQRAQWEIRDMADRMLDLLREVCPSVFAGAGPKCLRTGRCPEGKMGCGRFAEMKRKYQPQTAGVNSALEKARSL